MSSALQEAFSPRSLPNAFTATRLALVPVLLLLAAADHPTAFVAVLAVAFATDAIDGWLARRFRLESPLGAKLDSRADLALWLSLPLATWLLRPAFVRDEATAVGVLLASLALPLAAGLVKFRRVPSYHTWIAKGTAIVLAGAMLSIYLDGPLWPFQLATLLAVACALEELAITAILPELHADVRTWRAALRIRAKSRAR
ncbi:MAG TPA: CDP-alcohol phosphatidyltransferase family protein [Myxococcota bacterium]|jgi:CDP-diacylglycerol--glycerol-3-phosphate 3-phosphatidyltransferase